MQTIDSTKQRAAIAALAESPELNIPDWLYDEVDKRYKSISDHMERDGGAVADLDPLIYPQGSFQLGTVVRPVKKEGYDLDFICELRGLKKLDQSQQDVRTLVGKDVLAYAKQYGMQEPEDKCRCWRLEYKDDVTFHMDIIPALPEDESTKNHLRSHVEQRYQPLVDTAVAITCKEHENYVVRSNDWPKSNPKGYANWFRDQARRRFTSAVELRKAEEIPSYRWRTPLQVVVQILKRHRDVMFGDDRDAPISIIITTLAAHAYQGEPDLRDALAGIVARLPSFAGVDEPRIENPVNREENFADKWAANKKPERRDAYERWRIKVQEDVDELGQFVTKAAASQHFNRAFGATLKADVADRIMPTATVAATVAAPHIALRNEPRPWSNLD